MGSVSRFVDASSTQLACLLCFVRFFALFRPSMLVTLRFLAGGPVASLGANARLSLRS